MEPYHVGTQRSVCESITRPEFLPFVLILQTGLSIDDRSGIITTNYVAALEVSVDGKTLAVACCSGELELYSIKVSQPRLVSISSGD